MKYVGTEHVEIIAFDALNGEGRHSFMLTKMSDAQVVSVEFCCVPEFYYEFVMEDNTTYEQIKYNIMESIFESDSIPELLDRLEETFVDGFADIMIDENEDCCGCCGGCGHMN